MLRRGGGGHAAHRGPRVPRRADRHLPSRLRFLQSDRALRPPRAHAPAAAQVALQRRRGQDPRVARVGRRLAPSRADGRGRGGGGGGDGAVARPQPRDGEPRGRDQEGAIPRRRARQRDVRAAGAAGEADAPGVGLRQARVRGAARADAGAPPRPARDVLDLRRVQGERCDAPRRTGRLPHRPTHRSRPAPPPSPSSGEQARDHVPPHHRPLPQAGGRVARDLPPGADGRRPPARRHHLVLQPGALWVTPHICSHTASHVSHPAPAPPSTTSCTSRR